jgi:hypothetical protein
MSEIIENPEEQDEHFIEEIQDIVYPRFCIHCEHLAHAFHEDPCGDCVGFKIRLKSFKEAK